MFAKKFTYPIDDLSHVLDFQQVLVVVGLEHEVLDLQALADYRLRAHQMASQSPIVYRRETDLRAQGWDLAEEEL